MSDITPNTNDDSDEDQPEDTPSVGGSPARPDLSPNPDADPEDSRYEETPTDGDNSVDLENDAYVGVDTEYRNHAYDHLAPMKAEEDEDARKIEEQAKEHEVIRAIEGQNVGFRGYATETPHPSERENPADKYINANRQILQNQAGSGSSE